MTVRFLAALIATVSLAAPAGAQPEEVSGSYPVGSGPVAAAFTDADVQRLLKNEGIIRNRMKIEACISNAQVVQEIRAENGSFCGWFYDALEGGELAPLQKVLRAKFKFMGPEIARMWLMSSGRIKSE